MRIQNINRIDMKREILFKAKRKDNSEWQEGFYLKYDNKYLIHYEKEGIFHPFKAIIDPETVCQYTGLKDKKGKKIFEGDYIKAKMWEGAPTDKSYYNSGFVKWDNGQYTIEGFLLSEHEVFELTGKNIHD